MMRSKEKEEQRGGALTIVLSTFEATFVPMSCLWKAQKGSPGRGRSLVWYEWVRILDPTAHARYQ